MKRELAIAFALVVSAAGAGAVDLIVRLEPQATPDAVLERFPGSLAGSIAKDRTYLLRFAGGGPAIEDVAALDGVAYAEQNSDFHAPECLQSSIWFGGLVAPPAPLPVPAFTRAEVAILDGAVDATHPWLAGGYLGGRDFVEGDGDPSLSPALLASPASLALPGNEHATAVASALRAVTPGIRFRLYRVLDAGCRGSSFDLARGIVAAVDDGARVLVLPVGSRVPTRSVRDAIEYAAGFDAIVIAAAGNNGGTQLDYPASDGRSVAIAAVDGTGAAAPFTSFGQKVDLSDFGVWVPVGYPGNGLAYASGTSIAAARSAAAAAVVRSLMPDWTTASVLRFLQQTSAAVITDRSSSGALGAGRTSLDRSLLALSALSPMSAGVALTDAPSGNPAGALGAAAAAYAP